MRESLGWVRSLMLSDAVRKWALRLIAVSSVLSLHSEELKSWFWSTNIAVGSSPVTVGLTSPSKTGADRWSTDRSSDTSEPLSIVLYVQQGSLCLFPNPHRGVSFVVLVYGIGVSAWGTDSWINTINLWMVSIITIVLGITNKIIIDGHVRLMWLKK